MRVLWSSNSPFCVSGYGTQTNIACKRLKAMGHDVAIFAFYGLEGARTNWGDIPIYPNNARDWGIQYAPIFYNDWKADILLSLIDVWVQRGLNNTIKWVPWTPIDHNPPSPAVIQTLKESFGLVKPIAMSLYGQAQLKAKDIDAYYIPHSVDTKVFRPIPEWGKETRDKYGWQNKFVIGTVGTNNYERKNWSAALRGVALFAKKHPDEVVYIMHTEPTDNRGINLLELITALGLQDVCKFPSTTELLVGIPQEEMARMYSTLDVFLLPTKGEGFGIPLIEAQACGTPIITTNCTACTELMGGGWLLKDLTPQWTQQGSWQFECKPEEIAEKLQRAYEAKKKGWIVDVQAKARAKAMEYDEDVVFKELWPPVLADIEQRLKSKALNLEGVQEWRLNFIPTTCLPRRVLDIGCGMTQPYKKFLTHLGDYVGVDNRDCANGDVVKADANNLPFKDGEFGFVWCSEVLEHVDSPQRVVDEAKRVGKHGVILFSTPANQFFKLDPSHKIVNIPHSLCSTGDGLVTW
jgi:glycosyltransferase involved in cell wall biosynthesis